MDTEKRDYNWTKKQIEELMRNYEKDKDFYKEHNIEEYFTTRYQLRKYLSNALEYLHRLEEGRALTEEQKKDQRKYSNQLFPGAENATNGEVYQDYLKWLEDNKGSANPSRIKFTFKDGKKQDGLFGLSGPDYSSEPIPVFGGKRKSTTCKGTVYNIGGKDFCVGEKSSSKKYGTKRNKKKLTRKLGKRNRRKY